MINSPIYEILKRNESRFNGRTVIVAGQIEDASLYTLFTNAQHAYFICDNLVTYKQMLASLGHSFDGTFPQHTDHNNLTLIFGSTAYALTVISECDTLLLLLSKNKMLSEKLLHALNARLKEKSLIYTCGPNDGGAKSADTLLKPWGFTKKIDLARKCTMFEAILENESVMVPQAPNIKISIANHDLSLDQDPAVFSYQKLDKGTLLLLQCLEKIDVTAYENVLDLGCGCGIIGIILKKMGARKVTLSDVSASALDLSSRNLLENGIHDATLKACDMLQGLEKFDLIAVNPPFHQGFTQTTAPSVNMLMKAPAHLNAKGALIMVSNVHLGYEKTLVTRFDKVEVLARGNGFIVHFATLS